MIDVDLYADALVAIYRFNHAVAIDTIFPACMAPERSDAVKTCVLKACLMAVTEVGLYDTMASQEDNVEASYRLRQARFQANLGSPPCFQSSLIGREL